MNQKPQLVPNTENINLDPVIPSQCSALAYFILLVHLFKRQRRLPSAGSLLCYCWKWLGLGWSQSL